jgi:hypothetical protein
VVSIGDHVPSVWVWIGWVNSDSVSVPSALAITLVVAVSAPSTSTACRDAFASASASPVAWSSAAWACDRTTFAGADGAAVVLEDRDWSDASLPAIVHADCNSEGVGFGHVRGVAGAPTVVPSPPARPGAPGLAAPADAAVAELPGVGVAVVEESVAAAGADDVIDVEAGTVLPALADATG